QAGPSAKLLNTGESAGRTPGRGKAMGLLGERMGKVFVRSWLPLVLGIQAGCAALSPEEPVRRPAPTLQASRPERAAGEILTTSYPETATPSPTEGQPGAASSPELLALGNS